MGAALPIADHHDASTLRALARREKNGRVASRLVAIANAVDGMTRLAAARSAGMDRQTLRDNNRPGNLMALCQRCHLSHDRKEHRRRARITVLKRRALGDLLDGPYPA